LIRLYPLTPMNFTPFDPRRPARAFWAELGFGDVDDIAWLRDQGIVLTGSPISADLFIASRYPFPKRRARWLLRILRWKPVLIWTDEPRFATWFEPVVPARAGLPSLHVMNIYTGDVLLSNTTCAGWTIHRRLDTFEEQALPNDFNRGRQVVALATYRRNFAAQRLIGPQGNDIDLVIPRQNLILAGYRMGMVDIYGRNWPKGVQTVGESRGGEWYKTKVDIMRRYRFNICLENTSFPYYCSEKIWDSIRCGCLPIYHGAGNAIYEDFPPASFLDSAAFDSPEGLFEAVRQMGRQEYCERMNRCIDVYNRLYERGDFLRQRERMLENTVKKVHELVN